jgi:hypothetical protein
MAFPNGAEAAAERRAAGDEESGQSSFQPGPQPKPGVQSGPEDVTITIRGSIAARMLGRGDAEERILGELAGLSQHLHDMETVAARRAADHEALQRTVQGLQEKVAHLSGQMAHQVTELSRLRSTFDSHALSVVHLPGQLERALGQVSQLQMQVNPLAGELAQLHRRLAVLEPPPAPPPRPGVDVRVQPDAGSGMWAGIWDRFEKWHQPGKAPPNGNGKAAANGSWLKQRLNGLWLW